MTTEREMLDALHVKLMGEAQGNGGNRWIIAEHVRARCGFAGYRDGELGRLRTADALAIDTWLSKGMELHGFEVKCSRSDWLTELKAPEKSEPFRAICDRWWLVVSDASFVKDGELPHGWGLMALTTRNERFYNHQLQRYETREITTLRRVKKAPKMSDREPIPRHLLATLLRATATTASRRSVADA